VYDNQMTVVVGMHVQGRVHITEVTDETSEINPLSQFQAGQIIEEARVVGVSIQTTSFQIQRYSMINFCDYRFHPASPTSTCPSRIKTSVT